jgi:drug/metabolite transporter (DMT)-like permease
MTAAPPPRKTLVLVVVLWVIWGTVWPLFPVAVQEVSVWTFRAVSVTTAGLLLLAWSRRLGLPLGVARAHWPALVTSAVLYLTVWNVATTYASVLIPSGQAAVLAYTMPAWTTLLAWLFLRDRPGPRLLLAVALSALGVLLLLLAGRGSGPVSLPGYALGLLSAACWAGGTLVLRRARLPTPVPVLTAWQLLIAAVPIWLVLPFTAEGPWFVPTWQTIAAITYITLVPIAVGNALWFSIVGRLRASVAGLSAVMVPVVALVSGAVVRGEPLGPLQVLAMACCAGAVLLALRN